MTGPNDANRPGTTPERADVTTPAESRPGTAPQGAGATTPADSLPSAPAQPLPKALHRTFEVGIVLKGLDGVLEVIGGVLLLVLSPSAIAHLTRMLTAHELSEDPHDLVARYLLHTTGHLTTSTTLFGAIYLLSHGATKVVLVILVLRGKLWAYPWLIALLVAFIGYQLYRITAVHFSVGLAALTVFDIALVWLTWREYQARRGQPRSARSHETTDRASQQRP